MFIINTLQYCIYGKVFLFDTFYVCIYNLNIMNIDSAHFLNNRNRIVNLRYRKVVAPIIYNIIMIY